MSQRAERKADSRAAIIKESRSLLRAGGVAGMSVERAMAGAGLTAGAFYAHFSSKGDLLQTAFTGAIDDMLARLRGSLAGRSGTGALVDVISYYLSEVHRDDPKAGCPMPAVAGGAATGSTRGVQRLLAGGLAALVAEISAISENNLRDDGALALVILLVGGQIMARATGKTALSRKILALSSALALRHIDAERRQS